MLSCHSDPNHSSQGINVLSPHPLVCKFVWTPLADLQAETISLPHTGTPSGLGLEAIVGGGGSHDAGFVNSNNSERSLNLK